MENAQPDPVPAFPSNLKKAVDRAPKLLAVGPPKSEKSRKADCRSVEMEVKRALAGAVCLLAAMAAGCTTVPTEYAATLSTQDPKWQSPECQQIRAEASNYKEKPAPWAAGLLLGPYGLGLVAAAKEQHEKQRRRFARDLHLRCSSLPLPQTLQGDL